MTAIDLATLRKLWQGASCELDDASMERVRASAASVERIVASGETVYGINTGFGLLANTRIPPERLATFRQAFGVPEEFRPVGCVSVGYPGDDDRRSPSLRRGRRGVDDVVHRGHW